MAKVSSMYVLVLSWAAAAVVVVMTAVIIIVELELGFYPKLKYCWWLLPEVAFTVSVENFIAQKLEDLSS